MHINVGAHHRSRSGSGWPLGNPPPGRTHTAAGSGADLASAPPRASGGARTPNLLLTATEDFSPWS